MKIFNDVYQSFVCHCHYSSEILLRSAKVKKYIFKIYSKSSFMASTSSPSSSSSSSSPSSTFGPTSGAHDVQNITYQIQWFKAEVHFPPNTVTAGNYKFEGTDNSFSELLDLPDLLPFVPVLSVLVLILVLTTIRYTVKALRIKTYPPIE